ncbi:hypothetical protein Ciccas_009936 [Cichlidogyrus casuarinus]|uniref:Uncharacterized protein n=1 Tax=Cichlidogyrus casuarinus TaxID=1844966 RepID=A0ABD2PW30_9PLAT
MRPPIGSMTSGNLLDENSILLTVAIVVFGFVVLVINLLVISFVVRRRRKRQQLQQSHRGHLGSILPGGRHSAGHVPLLGGHASPHMTTLLSADSNGFISNGKTFQSKNSDDGVDCCGRRSSVLGTLTSKVNGYVKPENLEMNTCGSGATFCRDGHQYYMSHYVPNGATTPVYFAQNGTITRNGGVTFAPPSNSPNVVGVEQYYAAHHHPRISANSPNSSNAPDDQKTFSGYETGSDDATLTMKELMRQQNLMDSQKWNTPSGEVVTSASLMLFNGAIASSDMLMGAQSSDSMSNEQPKCFQIINSNCDDPLGALIPINSASSHSSDSILTNSLVQYSAKRKELDTNQTAISLINNSPAVIQMGRKCPKPYLVSGSGPYSCQVGKTTSHCQPAVCDSGLSSNCDCVLKHNTFLNAHDDYLDQGYSSRMTLSNRLYASEIAKSPQTRNKSGSRAPLADCTDLDDCSGTELLPPLFELNSLIGTRSKLASEFKTQSVSVIIAPSSPNTQTAPLESNGKKSSILKEALSVDSIEDCSDHTIQQKHESPVCKSALSTFESRSDTDDSYNSDLYLGRCRPSTKKPRHSLLDAILDIDQVSLSHSECLSSEHAPSTLQNIPSLDQTRQYNEPLFLDDRDFYSDASQISFEETNEPFSLFSVYSIDPNKYDQKGELKRKTSSQPKKAPRSKIAEDQSDLLEEYLKALETEQKYLTSSPTSKRLYRSVERSSFSLDYKSFPGSTRAQSLESAIKSPEAKVEKKLDDNSYHTNTFPYLLLWPAVRTR